MQRPGVSASRERRAAHRPPVRSPVRPVEGPRSLPGCGRVRFSCGWTAAELGRTPCWPCHGRSSAPLASFGGEPGIGCGDLPAHGDARSPRSGSRSCSGRGVGAVWAWCGARWRRRWAGIGGCGDLPAHGDGRSPQFPFRPGFGIDGGRDGVRWRLGRGAGLDGSRGAGLDGSRGAGLESTSRRTVSTLDRGSPRRRCGAQRVSWATSSAGSVVGRSQTKPRQT